MKGDTEEEYVPDMSEIIHKQGSARHLRRIHLNGTHQGVDRDSGDTLGYEGRKHGEDHYSPLEIYDAVAARNAANHAALMHRTRQPYGTADPQVDHDGILQDLGLDAESELSTLELNLRDMDPEQVWTLQLALAEMLGILPGDPRADVTKGSGYRTNPDNPLGFEPGGIPLQEGGAATADELAEYGFSLVDLSPSPQKTPL